MKKVSPEVDRGQIKEITLKRQITFNGSVIKKAVIEIDHINYGLNSKTKSLNEKKRSNFAINDIEKFLIMFDGEYVAAKGFRGRVSRFEVKIDCPVPGRFKGKMFIMIFETDYDKSEEIYTVTLFPGW
ncbi:MAG: hypothetical protein H7235_09480 [Bdellovibrionaceae bacterium]|nr:hypothetical protein [Pseudobdellovibrionaceae bacterium]